MSRSTSTHLVWALLVVIAFLAGLFIERSPAGGGENDSARGGAAAATASAGAARLSASPFSAGEREATEIGAVLSADEARAATFDVLREVKRIDRLSRLCELLRHVTPENWRAVMDAFTRQTAFEGRENGEEWKLMLQRVGEVARAEAVLDALNSNGANRADRARNTFEGWVMADSESALAWLRSLPLENQQTLDGAVIYGLARVAPLRALEYALKLGNLATRDWAIPQIVIGAVQQGGFRVGDELLASVKDRPDIPDALKGSLFLELAKKRMAMDRVRQQPMDSLQWLDGYLGEQSPAGSTAVGQMVASAAAADPAATMQWLDQRGDRLNQKQTVTAYTAALQGLYAQSPEKFTAWLTDHPKHPARDPVVEAFTNDLIAAGKTAEASNWMNTVQDVATKQRIQAALQKREGKTLKQP